MLKPCHDTKIERKYRYVLSEATDEIPTIPNPDGITDVIFQVGLNDTRMGVSPIKIREKTLDMQMKYKNQFPNARQHLVSLPPLDDPQIETNQGLQKLANLTNSNFISAKEFRDRTTGRLRKNLMNDYHYNNVGVKTLARGLKKSLFSDANLNNKSLAIICNMEQSVHSFNEVASN